MTVLFEFGFGYFVDGRSWEWLLQDYNVFQGRVWGLFLFSMFVSLYFVKLLNSRPKGGADEP